MQLYKELFYETSDLEVAKLLFKNNVENIEIGISSYCNRVCDYCPNNYVDRLSVDNKMDDKIFFRLMEQLKEIDYSGNITIHRYNEPFADFEYAVSRIKSIKEYLPRATLSISTNGDYLNKEKLLELHGIMSGNDGLYITVHNLPGRRDYEKLKKDLVKRVTALDLPYNWISNNDKTAEIRVSVGPNIRCEYRVINFYYESETDPNMLVSDRGEFIKLNQVKKRELPCFTTFIQIQIEWDGSLQPCCNIHSDVPQHAKYSTGKFDENGNIFLIYTSDTYVQWRRSMFSFEKKDSPCSTCTYTTNYDRNDNQQVREVVKHYRQLFELD